MSPNDPSEAARAREWARRTPETVKIVAPA